MQKTLSKRWWWMAPAALALAVGLYALAGYWLAPRLVRSMATDFVSAELGKRLSIGEIRIDPFRLRLDAGDIRIDDDNGQLVALRGLSVDLDVATLWRRGYLFDSIRLDAPYAHAVIRADGSLNLAELVPEGGDPDAPLPEIFVRSLEVAAGRVDFADHARSGKPEKTLAPIEFQLTDFRTTAEGGGFRLTAASERDERFDWSGRLSLRPLASEGAVAVGALQAQTVQAFVGDALPFVLSGGRIDLAMEYRFSAARGANLELDVTLPRIAAQELGLRARGVDEDWINVPGALVENARLSLAGRELAVEAVRATGVRATLWREADGTLNLARMLASPADADADADAAADGESAITTVDDAAWTYTVSRFELREGEATLQDRTVAPAATFRLQPLSLTAEDLGQDLAQPVPVTLETTVNGAAPLRISGTVVPDTFAAALDVDIAQLPLRELQSYLPTLPALRIRSGEVAGKGALTLRAQGDPGPGIEFSGAGSLSGFAVDETTDGRELLSWRRVSAEGLRYTAGPDAVSIRTLAVHAPSARVAILPDQSINFANALGAGAAGGSTPGPALKVDVDRIVIDAGRMGFSDFSIEPNFSADIEALRGTIRGVSTAPGSVAKLELAGHVVNRHSPVEISGETDFAAFDRHTDVRMAFRNIELPIFNPYSGRFAGYAIAKGKLSTELHYRIDDRALLADHHVVVDQLEWGEATDSQDKVTLPVRLATSLLKDRHGVIDLDLPISGTLDDPKFRIGPVVWQIIVNIVTRAVTAPFALLGSLFAGAEDAQFVDFAPGSAELSAGAAGGLGALAQALSEKVELKLDVPAGPAGEVDANALRERGFREALAALAGGDAAEFDYDALDADDRLDLLKRLYRQQFGSRAKPPDAPEPAEPAEDATRAERHEARDAFEIDWLESELRPRYAVDPQALAALGQARAAAVQEALLADGSIDAARVFVALDLAAAPHEDVVRMELQLK